MHKTYMHENQQPDLCEALQKTAYESFDKDESMTATHMTGTTAE